MEWGAGGRGSCRITWPAINTERPPHIIAQPLDHFATSKSTKPTGFSRAFQTAAHLDGFTTETYINNVVEDSTHALRGGQLSCWLACTMVLPQGERQRGLEKVHPSPDPSLPKAAGKPRTGNRNESENDSSEP